MSDQKETTAEKLEKRQKTKEEPCSICSAPRIVEFQEKDEETGKIQTRTHIVECYGHMNIPEYLWNKSSGYDKFKQWEVRHKQLCNKPSKKVKASNQ